MLKKRCYRCGNFISEDRNLCDHCFQEAVTQYDEHYSLWLLRNRKDIKLRRFLSGLIGSLLTMILMLPGLKTTPLLVTCFFVFVAFLASSTTGKIVYYLGRFGRALIYGLIGSIAAIIIIEGLTLTLLGTMHLRIVDMIFIASACHFSTFFLEYYENYFYNKNVGPMPVYPKA